MQQFKDLAGEAHYFEETINTEKIKHLLDNVESGTGKVAVIEKTEGMKYLLAMMAKGRDVSDFYPDVVRNVIVKDVSVKKLVYMYLVHHADANPTCRELALLAINSFQRDLSDSNQLIRALALRVLCSIRERDIVQIQLMSVKKCASDSSPYVRKTAAHSVGKIYQIDPDAKGELVDVVERLLGDKVTAVLSSAVAAYAEVCPENVEIFHPHYRKLCHLVADLDEWGQITAINVLTRYARTQFANPLAVEAGDAAAKKGKGKGKEKGKKGKKAFYSDSDKSDGSSSESSSEESSSEEEDEDAGPKISPDHDLLLKGTLPLLRSRNSGVVLAVAALHQAVGVKDRLTEDKIGKALVRVMRNHREIQYIVLTSIVQLAKQAPSMFRKYLKDFYIAESEPAFVRRMKLDVLSALVSEDNKSLVLHEFQRYVKDDDKDFVRAAIQAVVRIANALPSIANRVLRGLMALVSTDAEAVVAEAVIAIRQLLQQHPEHDALIVRLGKRLAVTKGASARSAIVWIVGEFQNKPRVAAMAPDALRQLAKQYRSESAEVKYQVLNLAAKTALYQPEQKQVALLLKYILELARYDADFDLRDRARLLRHLMLGSEVTSIAADAAEEAGSVIALGAGKDSAGVPEVSPAEIEALAAAKAAALADAAAVAALSAKGEGAPGEEDLVSPPASASPAAENGGGFAVSSPRSTPVASPVDLRGSSPMLRSETPLPSPTEKLVPPVPSIAASPPPAPAAKLVDRVKAVLLAAKPPPAIESALAETATPTFQLGSLSFIVGHATRSYYPVPEWATEDSEPTLRDPPKEEEDKPRKKKGKGKGKSRSSSSSSSSSESDSGSGSGSEDKEDKHSSSGSSESHSKDVKKAAASGSSESETGSSASDSDGGKKKPKAGGKAPAPAPAPAPAKAPAKKQASSDESASSSSNESSSSSSESEGDSD